MSYLILSYLSLAYLILSYLSIYLSSLCFLYSIIFIYSIYFIFTTSSSFGCSSWSLPPPGAPRHGCAACAKPKRSRPQPGRPGWQRRRACRRGLEGKWKWNLNMVYMIWDVLGHLYELYDYNIDYCSYSMLYSLMFYTWYWTRKANLGSGLQLFVCTCLATVSVRCDNLVVFVRSTAIKTRRTPCLWLHLTPDQRLSHLSHPSPCDAIGSSH